MGAGVKIGLLDYQGKGRYLATRLAEHGFDLTAELRDAEVLLVQRPAAWRRFGDTHPYFRLPYEAQTHGRVLLVGYPHGANAVIEGIATPHVDLELVHGPGHADALAAAGFLSPVVVCGWTYCERREFRVRADGGLLFCDPHGPLEPLEERARSRAWQEYGHQRGRLELRTSRVGPIDASVVDDAGCVLAAGTLLYVAVARGVPAVAVYDHEGYPYQVGEAPLDELIEQARDPGPELAVWRDRWIGGDLDVGLVAESIRGLKRGEQVAVHALEGDV